MSLETETRMLRSRITELFGVYPRMSPTMLQAALGPSLSPRIWRPVMDKMIHEGTLTLDAEMPPVVSGRSRPYTVLSLTSAKISSIAVPPPPRASVTVTNGIATPQLIAAE